MEASFPIKVTYQGTTLRFREPVDSDRNLVTGMDGLKDRIFSLFNIPPYSDVSIAYVDDCDDMVNLVRDEDLLEAMLQNLECLKIMVGNSERVCSLYSTGRTSSAPYKTHTLPDLSVAAKSLEATREVRPSVYVGAGCENASKGFAFGESSLSSGIGMERGIRQVPTEDNRQLKLENEDLKNRLEQHLRQIKGNEVVIGDAPAETFAPAMRDSWDDSEAELQREFEALRSERERLLQQNKILKEIERNKGKLQAEIEALSNENKQLWEIEALSNENKQLRQRNQNVEESNSWAQRYSTLGWEEESGKLITVPPPVNSSNHLTWLQAVVPSLGRVLSNVGSWLRVTLQLLLSIVNLLPWRQILRKAHFLIGLVYNTISSSFKWVKGMLYDVMVDITRAMVAQNAGRLVMHSA